MIFVGFSAQTKITNMSGFSRNLLAENEICHIFTAIQGEFFQ